MTESIKARIEKRAFELFTKRGGTEGYAIDDWLLAEQDVLAQKPSKPARKKTAKKKTIKK